MYNPSRRKGALNVMLYHRKRRWTREMFRHWSPSFNPLQFLQPRPLVASTSRGKPRLGSPVTPGRAHVASPQFLARLITSCGATRGFLSLQISLQQQSVPGHGQRYGATRAAYRASPTRPQTRVPGKLKLPGREIDFSN